MDAKLSKLKYWCVHKTDAPRKLLIVADKPLYSRQAQLEKELEGVCAVTFVNFPPDTDAGDFKKKLALLVGGDPDEYDAVCFRPEFTDSALYGALFDRVLSAFPGAKPIPVFYGDPGTDRAVSEIAGKAGISAAREEELRGILSALPARKESKAADDGSEAVGWLIYETRERIKELPRVLLIGDSIVWGAHEAFCEATRESFHTTTFVSSMGVNEKRLSDLITGFAEADSAKYDAVYFNNGLHTHSQTPDEYETNFRETLSRLREYFSGARLTVGLSTKISDNPNSAENTDTPITERAKRENAEKNSLILSYNERVRRIAEDEGLRLLDAYSLVEDKDSWKIDPYHYDDRGRRLIGEAIARFMTEN